MLESNSCRTWIGSSRSRAFKVVSVVSTNTSFRLLTLLFIAAACTLGNQTFQVIVFVLGIAHYFLAAFYSKRHFKDVASNFKTLSLFGLVTASGTGLYFFNVPLIWLTLFHHNFNEVYMRDAFRTRSESTKRLRVSCVILNMFLFCSILRHHAGIRFINHEFLLGGVVVSTVWYVIELLRNRHRLTTRELIDSTFYEIVSFGLLALSLYQRLTLTHFFLYHFVYWALYPLPGILKKGTRSVAIYGGLHALLLPIIWALSAQGPFSLSDRVLAIIFPLLGFTHISMSFALSLAQPSWVTNIFRTRPRTPAPVPSEGKILAPIGSR